MDDLIRRQSAIDLIDEYMDNCIELHYLPTGEGIKTLILALPSAQQKGDIEEAVEYIKNAQEYLRDIGETWCANYLSDAIELLVGGRNGFQKTL